MQGHLVDDPRGALVRGILRDLLPEEEERMVTRIAEQWMAEGFTKGLAEGRASGMAEGEAKGEAKGRAEGKAEILLRQLKRRFGRLPADIEAHLRAAEDSRLDMWSDRILDACELSDVFQDD